MSNDKIIVLKFGSSVLKRRADLPTAVHEIYRWYRSSHRVLAVVSAIGRTTNALLREVRSLTAEPQPHALAELLAVGERHSAALLGVSLDRAGVPARVIDPREIGLHVTGSVIDGELDSIDTPRLQALLAETAVLVIPGFFGFNENGRLALLGRGGSDLSAVFLAGATHGARCRLLKDVDGVYASDPHLGGPTAGRRFSTLNYADALKVAGPLVQPKAVEFLAAHSRSVEVAALARPYESLIGPANSNLALVATAPPKPLNVLLLGLGTVGFGVYERLRALSDEFSVVGVLVRDPAKHIARGVPPELLHTDRVTLEALRPDIIVDALPGVPLAELLLRHFLERGASAVSANKALIAEHGPKLAALAARRNATLHYSAAVGGSAPMIEAVRREAEHGEIRALSGVLNGTCNYVLERYSSGASLLQAIQEAQTRGFAEPDPAEDLCGADAARKLRILARHAFGEELKTIVTIPLSADTLAQARHAAASRGAVIRMVATASKKSNRLSGQVQLEVLDTTDPLARATAEWNTLTIARNDGTIVTVTGRGAGRWPTTEAVIADLFDIRRSSHASSP